MNKRIVIATDSFKGSLTSYEAGVAISEGISKAVPDALILIYEVADGGEGTSAVMTKAVNGTVHTVEVTGPLPSVKVNASYGIKGTTAIMDIASACGLTLIEPSSRNPLHTTTYGVGQMITDALDKGCRDFIIGLGGSSSNDCGAGMLQALGLRLTDEEGLDIRPGAIGLSDIHSIDTSSMDPRIRECTFTIACDVTNPLTGTNGCSMVFAPQKGADRSDCLKMDQWIEGFLKIAGDEGLVPGDGAAGGLGFAFRFFLNGKTVPGADLIIDRTGLGEVIHDSDYVITGEGRLDEQTIMGKLPSKIALLGRKSGARVIAFAGCTGEGLSDTVFDEVYSISEGIPQEESMRNAAALLTQKAYEVFNGRSV